jgi:hypothetical protein
MHDMQAGSDAGATLGDRVVGVTTELRLDPPRREDEERTAVLVFADPGTDAYDLPPGTGVHLWIDRKPIKEFRRLAGC